jgi:hypothetical protein
MSPSRSQLGTWPLPERLARQVLPQVRFPSEAVPRQRGSLLLARLGSPRQGRPDSLLQERPDSLLLERPDSLLQERPADSQPEGLRAEMFLVAREIAPAKSAQMRVRLGRQ